MVYTKQERRERAKQASLRQKERRKRILLEVFGEKCFFCGNERTRILHRKDGTKHLRRLNIILAEKEKYVRVCQQCHRGVHFAMEFFGLDWNGIIEMLK